MALTHATDKFIISQIALIVVLAYMVLAVLLMLAEQDNVVTVIWVITIGKVRTVTFQVVVAVMQA